MICPNTKRECSCRVPMPECVLSLNKIITNIGNNLNLNKQKQLTSIEIILGEFLTLLKIKLKEKGELKEKDIEHCLTQIKIKYNL